MRIDLDLGDVHHRAEGDHAAQTAHELGLRKAGRRRGDGADQRLTIVGAGLGRGEARIGEDRPRIQRLAQGLEEALLLSGDGDEAVGGWEHAERRQERVVVAFGARDDPLGRTLPDHPLAQRQHAIDHRDVDELPFPGAPCMVDRRQYAKG